MKSTKLTVCARTWTGACLNSAIIIIFLFFLQAQFYIYDKIKSDGYLASDDHCIKLEIKVPQKVIGRIIGKGGQNVSTCIVVYAVC